MAAITRVKARPVSPPGYEVNDTGVLTEDVIAGDQLIIAGTTAGNITQWSKAPISAKEGDGIALMDGKSGGVAEVGIQGEMEGFSGMTARTAIYPSSSVAGGLDTTAPVYYTSATTPVVNVPAVPKVKAISATRIRFSYL